MKKSFVSIFKKQIYSKGYFDIFELIHAKIYLKKPIHFWEFQRGRVETLKMALEGLKLGR